MTDDAIQIACRAFAVRDSEAVKALFSAEFSGEHANEYNLMLNRACATLEQQCPEREQVSLFVASRHDEVVAYVALIRATGFDPLRFWLRRSTIVHASSELAIFNCCETLTLCNDMVGVSELVVVQSSQLSDTERGSSMSQLLTSAVKHWRQQYTSHHLVMQLSGVKTPSGDSVFWQHYGQHFAPSGNALNRSSSHGHCRAALATLLPHHPVYTSFLDDAAQRALGQPDERVRDFAQHLQSLGFRSSAHVDCIDGGPLMVLHR